MFESPYSYQAEIDQQPPQPGRRYPAPPPRPPVGLPATPPPGHGYVPADPRSLRRCLYRLVLIWRRGSRNPYWAWLIAVSRNVVSGYRWSQRRNIWVYFTININEIRYFQCY
ncbi:hypothetical protein [Thermoflavimicrobium daqui]|uniref:Uncharacterized protein n=1 Tax=Thermoflavimicrobium daqui TaxID=2137476 RepID=A0A364K0H9_9BACL|nr:hypothetical protein [Thermoflavimicrobium daqui]RAL20853.1 hypothetical protein DL897_17625 [Thermoflavimicrobium daqui]